MFLAQQSQVSALMQILHDLALFCMLIPTIFVIVIYFEILDLKKKNKKIKILSKITACFLTNKKLLLHANLTLY